MRASPTLPAPAALGMALAGSLLAGSLLAGCGPARPPSPTTPTEAPSASPGSSPTSGDTAPPNAAAPPGTPGRPCHTAQLSAHLGTPGPAAVGLRTVPLVYTNVSDTPCTLRGAPDVELHGPDDPNGPVFEMSIRDTGATSVTLRPGGSATASILVQEDSPGRTGHGGSTGWAPTLLVSTPPGETATLRTPWTAGGTVLREDSSTHPDEYVLPFRP